PPPVRLPGQGRPGGVCARPQDRQAGQGRRRGLTEPAKEAPRAQNPSGTSGASPAQRCPRAHTLSGTSGVSPASARAAGNVRQRRCSALGSRQTDAPTVSKRLPTDTGRWAVVGLSANRARTAHGIAGYVRDLGHEIVPVHPKAETVYDQQGYPDLASVPGDVDVVDVFVNSELAGGVVDDAIARGAKAVWLQQGVIDEAAAQRATDAGLDVVMDTCPAIEAPRLGLV